MLTARLELYRARVSKYRNRRGDFQPLSCLRASTLQSPLLRGVDWCPEEDSNLHAL